MSNWASSTWTSLPLFLQAPSHHQVGRRGSSRALHLYKQPFPQVSNLLSDLTFPLPWLQSIVRKTFLAQSRRHGQVRPAAYGEVPGAQARFIQTKEAKYKLVKRKHLWNPLSSPQHSHWWKTGVLLWCVVSLPTKTFELWCRGHRPVFVHTPHIQVKERKIWIGI